MISTFSKASVAEVLAKDLGIANPMAVPTLQKIVINVGIGSWLQGGKDFARIIEGVEKLSGQKPVVRKAKQSISNFKLRKGMPVGISVTLRGEKMYNFLERMVKVVAPRIRDFDGFSNKSFDGKGSYSFGLTTYAVFPEIHYSDVVKNYGVGVTVVTTSRNVQGTKALLKTFGFPFKKEL